VASPAQEDKLLSSTDKTQLRPARATVSPSGTAAMNNKMSELQLNGLALELIDLAQARGARPGDAISAFSLAAGTLIANNDAKPGSRETLLRACIAVITEIASAGPHALPPPPKKRSRFS